MNYDVIIEGNDYIVVEKRTDHRIERFKDIKTARQYCRKLNGGSMGFQGWTPQFLALKG